MFQSPKLSISLSTRAALITRQSISRPKTLPYPGRILGPVWQKIGLRHPQLGSIQNTALQVFYSTKPLTSTSNNEKKLEAHPDRVTGTSTTRPLFEPDPAKTEVDKQDAQDIFHDVKADLNTVKDTFALTSVPRESYALGLAGTLPYLGTSISTVYLGWNLRTPWPTDNNLLNSFMVSNETAQQWLQLLEPIQLGYGAVIISFLGAIHWGLEYAEKSPAPDRTRFRYAIGVLAPAVAWPTLMMPIQFALISQFAAFTALYFVDSRATARGWTPPWYGTYRFVLTFIVGGAIFISLVGRAKVGDDRARLSTNRLEETMSYKHNHHNYSHWAKLEEEERERNRKEKEAAEKKKEQEEKSKSKGKTNSKKSNKSSRDGKSGAADGSSADESSEQSGGKDDEDQPHSDDEEESSSGDNEAGHDKPADGQKRTSNSSDDATKQSADQGKDKSGQKDSKTQSDQGSKENQDRASKDGDDAAKQSPDQKKDKSDSEKDNKPQQEQHSKKQQDKPNKGDDTTKGTK